MLWNFQRIPTILTVLATCRFMSPPGSTLPDWHIGSDFLTLRRSQPVFLFKLTAYVLALIEVVAVGYAGTVRAHTQSHYVYVVAVYVLMLHYYVWHIAEPHLLHILVGELGIFPLA